MAVKSLLIGYDLNRPGQDYSSLIKEIKAFETWWHHLDSTWIVRTSKTTNEVRDVLKQHIDSGDELLVAELTGNAAWVGFNQTGSKWLKENL
ncbi:hypothetical protein OG884_12060 [Streptosporangium sp. NBC_01755]|uniref:hypothetical protein n=1 Tax=Streptosporangium sp. NBC_01755 TaxID=2975949 RepID=UPI002DDA98E4|nr:hypothetical protein [Streptosporangium sp. NBC_01755]WSD02597.1 hypothetical protein OG884_12060 [Streptosporangium sp. NBC_01755]